MLTVLLVGAGATLAEALPSHPRRELRPPLDATFFDLCRLARLEGRTPLRRYTERNFGVNPFDGMHRMEEIFNYVYADALSESPPEGSIDAYDALIKLYTTAIARTTNWLSCRSQSGVAALIRSLWLQDPDRDFVFITFNQDLVIENALEEAVQTRRYADMSWDLLTCYPVDFEEGYQYSTNEATFRARGGPSFTILKMHGSLNWFYTARSAADAKNSIRTSGKKLLCLGNRQILSGLRMRRDRRSVHLVPLVVPPILEKGTQFRQALGPVWTQAREAIQQADVLLVFGYSFPDADVAARGLLRSAFHGNRALREVSVVDIEAGVAAKIAALCDAPSVHYHRSVRALLNG